MAYKTPYQRRASTIANSSGTGSKLTGDKYLTPMQRRNMNESRQKFQKDKQNRILQDQYADTPATEIKPLSPEPSTRQKAESFLAMPKLKQAFAKVSPDIRDEVNRIQQEKYAKSKIGSFGYGVADGATLGALTGAQKYFYNKAGIKPLADTARETNPFAYGAGSMVGTALPVSGVSSALKPVTGAAMKATSSGVARILGKSAGTTLGKAVATLAPKMVEGAMIGAPIDAGRSIIEGDNIKTIGKNVLSGAAIGAAADVGLYGAGKALKPVANKLGLFKPKAVSQAVDSATDAASRIRGKSYRVSTEAADRIRNPFKPVASAASVAEDAVAPVAKQADEVVEAASKPKLKSPEYAPPKSLTKEAVSEKMREVGGFTGNEHLFTKEEIEAYGRGTSLEARAKNKQSIASQAADPKAKETKWIADTYKYDRKVTKESADAEIKSMLAVHKSAVEDAVKKGVPVSEDVINDYPWLRAKNDSNIIKDNASKSSTIAASVDDNGAAYTLTSAIDENPNVPLGEKERGFNRTVRTAEDTPQAAKDKLYNEPNSYEPISNADTAAKAKEVVDADPDGALRKFSERKGGELKADDVALGEMLIKRAFANGNDGLAYDIITDLGERLTTAGQGVQAASMFKRLTPEGMLMYAERTIDRANKAIGKGYFDPLEKLYKKGKLTDEAKDRLIEAMRAAQKLPEGQEKANAMARVMKEIDDAMPKAPFEAFNRYRLFAMLSNPKTWIRNFSGNALFGATDTLVSKPIASGIDAALSLRTGKRTTLLPDLKAGARGFWEQTKGAASDFATGLDTSPTRGTFELPSRVMFDKVPGLKWLGRTVKAGVSGGDRPFYGAARDMSMSEQIRLKQINTGKDAVKVTKGMAEIADKAGKYATFADNNKISDFFVGIKRLGNKIRVGGVGMGDVLMPFAKTPANLLARGLDYSPAGMAKGIVNTIQVLAGNSGLQKQAAEGLARGAIGTGIVGGAIMLKNAGIIRGKKYESGTANQLENATGRRQYTVNTSALKRFVESGMDPDAAKARPDDSIATFDWMQPLAISASMGTDVGETLKRGGIKGTDLIGLIVDSMESGTNTMFDQPMLQSIKQIMQGDNIVEGLLYATQSYPASFVPAFLQGTRYAVDPYLRDTSAKNYFKGALNIAKSKVPVVSQSLPKTVDVLGNDRKVTGDTAGKRIVGGNISPAIISSIKDDKVGETVYNLYSASMDGGILPRYLTSKAQLPARDEGQKAVDLSGEQRGVYQKILADEYTKEVNAAMKKRYTIYKDKKFSSGTWDDLTQEKKLETLRSIRASTDDSAQKKMQEIVFGKAKK